MLNACRAKEFVVPSTLSWCITCALLFFADVPGTFSFNATHQLKAIAIGVSKANPLVRIVSVFLFPSLYTYGTYVYANYIKRGMYPYLVFLYCNQYLLHNCVWQYSRSPNVTFIV